MNASKEATSNSNDFESSEEALVDDFQDDSQSTSMVALQKSGFKLQLVEKLTEIDKRYKQGVQEYKESIQAYNIEIEKLRNQIALESEYCVKEEKSLLMIEHELRFESKAYENLQVKFSGLINPIEELQSDYKDVLDAVRYESTLKRKEKELFECLEDIELAELTLLNKELERLNIFEQVEPKQIQLKKLKMTLKEVEMQKAYFESMGLHKVSSVQVENKNFWKGSSSEVVDTVEIENDK